MAIFKHINIHIYIGDAADKVFPTDYQTPERRKQLYASPAYQRVVFELQLKNIFFLKQVHGTSGTMYQHSNIEQTSSFEQEGDFLITDVPGIGIGIMTADCLPIVCVDTKRQVVGIAHAGWRGSVQGVGRSMILNMQKHFNSVLSDMEILFGPSAGLCCYQVGSEVRDALKNCSWSKKVLQHRSQQVYFDLVGYNYYQLIDAGIPATAFTREYHACTICNDDYFSYRRQGKLSGRNMTIVSPPLR